MSGLDGLGWPDPGKRPSFSESDSATDACAILRRERDALAEALLEMQYGHTDKAERMAVAALAYLKTADAKPSYVGGNETQGQIHTKMIATKFTSEEGIKGLSIEIDGRGADFYADGSYFAWDGNGAFNRCDAMNRLSPYVSRNVLKEGIAAAEKELGVTFDVASIGVYVDEEGNVDPLNEIA